MDAKKINILIVDDEQLIRETLSSIFEMEGYNIYLASSGNSALKILSEKDIQVVISDVKMPNGNGIELLKSIRKANPALPFVVLISGFTEISQDETKELGAIDLMEKPIQIDNLLSLVDNLVKEMPQQSP